MGWLGFREADFQNCNRSLQSSVYKYFQTLVKKFIENIMSELVIKRSSTGLNIVFVYLMVENMTIIWEELYDNLHDF